MTVTVVYAITAYGKSVFPVTEMLVKGGINHREQLRRR
ncbi:hypothetical protein PBAL39_22190 [Pedobacter sp. BAL39]|nr:hypothetical protein PBAL39_22190 [Pedobacter sp. BAL39]